MIEKTTTKKKTFIKYESGSFWWWWRRCVCVCECDGAATVLLLLLRIFISHLCVRSFDIFQYYKAASFSLCASVRFVWSLLISWIYLFSLHCHWIYHLFAIAIATTTTTTTLLFSLFLLAPHIFWAFQDFQLMVSLKQAWVHANAHSKKKRREDKRDKCRKE